MAKELPYFKFYASEWLNGDITLYDYDTQGVFMNICAYYWARKGDIDVRKLKRRFMNAHERIDLLLDENLISVTKDGLVSIRFLDEQVATFDGRSLTSRVNGAKGGRPKKPKKPNSNLKEPNIEEKRGEEKREDNNKDADALGDTNISEVIFYLNEKTGKNFKTAPGLKTRFKEGYTVDDCKKVIDIKCAEWIGTEREKYLRPQTLFSNKFDSYVNQEPEEKAEKRYYAGYSIDAIKHIIQKMKDHQADTNEIQIFSEAVKDGYQV